MQVLSKDIYVDDANPGADTGLKQILSTQSVLGCGGFGLKFVIYSGRAPREGASPDRIHMKLLGYKWNSEQDVLYPGFAELNFKKRI